MEVKNVLVEFRVKNFKSIRDEQVFSMVASTDTALEDTHVLTPDGTSVRLLKSAAIYGPNAGGKSNLLKAFDFMLSRLVYRQTPPSTIFSVNKYVREPFFKLDLTSRNMPSEFEVIYIDKGVRYQYGFSILRERIIEEWLLVYKSDKPQEWFRRIADKKTDQDSYKFSSYFKGQKEVWKKSTRKEALFLSVAVDLNSEQLWPIYQYLLELNVLDSFSYFVEELHFDRLENKQDKKISLIS